MKKIAGFIFTTMVVISVWAQNSALHLTINGGKHLTNNQLVTLTIAAPHATHMMLSNTEDFKDVTWQVFVASKQWKLEGNDGMKVIYARFKDKAGNESEKISQKIELDRSAPSNCSISINKNEELTKKNTVHLELNADGASHMMVSNRPNFVGATWKEYQSTVPSWLLEGADGPKVVYVKYKDKAENVSDIVSAKITYDKTPPIGTAFITGQPKWINSNKIKLELNCPDAEKMKISTLGDEWIPYQATKDLSLPEGDGPKTISVLFVDKAHNVSKPVSMSVNLKTNPPTDAKIMIDNGVKYTTRADKKVTIRIHAIGAKFMMLSNTADFAGAKWEPYLTTKPYWLLPGEDGEKNVYVKFKDEAANETQPVSSQIILDRAAPTNCSVTINGGESTTNKSMVKLTLKATDAVAMEVSTSNTFAGASWVKFSEEKEMDIAGADGIKTVYARFKDKAGNVTPLIKGSIKLDKTPPMGSVVKINNGVEWANSPDVILSFTSRDAKEIMISSTGSFDNSKWEPMVDSKKYKLEGDDGIKKIGVKFKDEAGNSSSVVIASIKLSTKPPEDIKISIDKDAEFSTHKDRHVTLTLSATGASKMMISNDSSFVKAAWVPFSTTRPLWTLPLGDGEKKVYAKFISVAGIESKVVSDAIIQDLTPPTKCSITINGGAQGTNDKEGAIKIDLTTEGGTEIMLTDNGSFEGKSWEPFAPTKNWNLTGADGVKKIGVKFKDKSGNITSALYAVIKLDRSPPVGSVIINGGKKFTTSKDVKLVIKATDAHQMQISNTSSFGSEWLPVALEKNWSLTDGDGLKTVYIRFRDQSENLSEVSSAGIELDSKGPDNGSIVINDNAEYCTDKTGKVKVVIKSSEDATKMKISNRMDFNGSTWIAFTGERDWSLIPGEEERMVSVKFMDEAGNESVPVSDVIKVDFTPPTAGKITIDNGRKYSKSKDWTAALSIESEGASEMMISNNADFSDGTWEPYATTKPWVLKEGEGKKVVYIKFRDVAGNSSTPVSDDIESDTVF